MKFQQLRTRVDNIYIMLDVDGVELITLFNTRSEKYDDYEVEEIKWSKDGLYVLVHK